MALHVNKRIEQEPRRMFLGFAGLGLIAASTFAVAGGRKAKDASMNMSVMQAALALEHEGIAAYRLACGSGLLKPGTLKLAQVFMGHHEQHRDSLASLISKAGGKPVQPQSDDQYVKALNLGALKTEGDVVVLATRLEQGAASAYVGQVRALHDPKLAQLFSSLAADEAVHWTTLNNAQRLDIRTCSAEPHATQFNAGGQHPGAPGKRWRPPVVCFGAGRASRRALHSGCGGSRAAAFGPRHGVLTFTDALTPSPDARTAALKTILSEAVICTTHNKHARMAVEGHGACFHPV